MSSHTKMERKNKKPQTKPSSPCYWNFLPGESTPCCQITQHGSSETTLLLHCCSLVFFVAIVSVTVSANSRGHRAHGVDPEACLYLQEYTHMHKPVNHTTVPTVLSCHSYTNKNTHDEH